MIHLFTSFAIRYTDSVGLVCQSLSLHPNDPGTGMPFDFHALSLSLSLFIYLFPLIFLSYYLSHRPEYLLDGRLTHSESELLLTNIEQRVIDRKPTAYITGEALLGRFSFRADPRAIIPRSCTLLLCFSFCMFVCVCFCDCLCHSTVSLPISQYDELNTRCDAAQLTK